MIYGGTAGFGCCGGPLVEIIVVAVVVVTEEEFPRMSISAHNFTSTLFFIVLLD